MSKKTRDEREHQQGVEALVLRLLNKPYDAVLMNPTYHAEDRIGELDVLAIRGDVAHYYEVKLHANKSSYKHAKSQVHRVQEAFPKWDVKGVYYPLNGYPRRIK